MTNPQLHAKPSRKQLQFHRDLVEQTGAGFPPPKTKDQARRQIRTMLALPRDRRADRLRERHAIRADFEDLSGDAARVRDEELSGYGSTASWRRTA
jgi:hypothetical protein